MIKLQNNNFDSFFTLQEFVENLLGLFTLNEKNIIRINELTKASVVKGTY